MLRPQKEQLSGSMAADVARSAAVLFVDYTGMTVEESTKLRVKLRQSEVGYQVVKNTLLMRALEGKPYADASKCIKGTPTGVIFGYADPVLAAKLTFEFLAECEHLKVKGGILDAKAITSDQAKSLSKMPSRAELQATVVAQALSPARTFASQLKAQAGRVVGAIDALVKRFEAGKSTDGQ